MPLTLETRGDTQVIVRRRFAAPPEAVYRAHVEPDLIRQWMTGPEGWRVTECISDPVPGGTLHVAWANDEGEGFKVTGEYRALEPGKRIAHVERMHLPDPTPDNEIETLFKAEGTGTLLVMTMTLPDAAPREAMPPTGMAQGMVASYVNLDALA
jgi:uncharacterized protein YndB with AHSA1/START domain